MTEYEQANKEWHDTLRAVQTAEWKAQEAHASLMRYLAGVAQAKADQQAARLRLDAAIKTLATQKSEESPAPVSGETDKVSIENIRNLGERDSYSQASPSDGASVVPSSANKAERETAFEEFMQRPGAIAWRGDYHPHLECGAKVEIFSNGEVVEHIVGEDDMPEPKPVVEAYRIVESPDKLKVVATDDDLIPLEWTTFSSIADAPKEIHGYDLEKTYLAHMGEWVFRYVPIVADSPGDTGTTEGEAEQGDVRIDRPLIIDPIVEKDEPRNEQSEPYGKDHEADVDDVPAQDGKKQQEELVK